MASASELLLFLNASCAPCADLGPPPDAILHIPPPPLPAFLQRAPPPPPPPPLPPGDAAAAAAAAAAAPNASLAAGADDDTCSARCEWGAAGPGGVQYVELPRQGPAAGDTWLLVLIASSAGVLLLGALLALLLLKCRVQRAGKAALHLEPAALRHGGGRAHGGGGVGGGVGGGAGGGAGAGAGGCGAHGPPPPLGAPALGPSRAACAAVLYPGHGHAAGGGGGGVGGGGAGAGGHGGVLWAALTPRGTTRHHFARPLPAGGPGGAPAVATAGAAPAPPLPATPPPPLPMAPPPRCASFDNTAFVEEAAAAAAAAAAAFGSGGCGGGESYPLAERSPAPPPRPRVSSPTRIEHPNLPPLNLLPTMPRTRRAAPHAPPGSAAAPPPHAHAHAHAHAHPAYAAPVVL